MKKLIIILGILFTSVLIMQSCTKDNDLLDDGDIRESFMGNWSATDNCTKQTYGVEIDIDNSNSSQVIIENFANLGQDAKAVIAGSSIYVENQDIGGGYKVSGNGKLTGSIIIWSMYSFESSAESRDCSATFSK